jgi:hypothetical protein
VLMHIYSVYSMCTQKSVCDAVVFIVSTLCLCFVSACSLESMLLK